MWPAPDRLSESISPRTHSSSGKLRRTAVPMLAVSSLTRNVGVGSISRSKDGWLMRFRHTALWPA